MSHSNLLPAAIEDILRRHNATGRRICIGLSGGMDSVVLLDLLAQVRVVWGMRLSAIHVHHGLSPNADEWATFCESLCAERAIPLQVAAVKIDLALTGGVESLARDARYLAFDKVDADLIALAQHTDDQAETVLHQILRGTGLKGMAGMGEWRPLRDGLTLMRPLLGVSRADIEVYAGERRLEWIDDESNTDMAYTRNFIRHALMPTLEERFPHYRESLARIGRHAAEADEMLSALAAIDLKWDGRDAFADLLDELPLTRQVNALYHWLHWQLDRGDHTNTFPSQAQLAEWALQLFRAALSDRPHQAGGHDFVILRRKNLLQLVRK
ncbi:MAG: tRNA lysidine(34) synthetase TilS [Betaproteobacteria bacterium]